MTFRSNLLQYVYLFEVLADRKYVKYKAFAKKISSCVGQKHLNSSGSMIYMQDRHLNACLDFCGNLADF